MNLLAILTVYLFSYFIGEKDSMHLAWTSSWHDVPDGYRLFGVISIGYGAETDKPSPSVGTVRMSRRQLQWKTMNR